jgi:hypothetical protein
MRRRGGCSACGSTEHNLRTCDTPLAAELLEVGGNAVEAEKMRRRIERTKARAADVTPDRLRDELATARRNG